MFSDVNQIRYNLTSFLQLSRLMLSEDARHSHFERSNFAYQKLLTYP